MGKKEGISPIDKAHAWLPLPHLIKYLDDINNTFMDDLHYSNYMILHI